jgi:hypothetical protein
LEQGPKEAKKDLVNWEVEEFEGENVLFYKEKNYVPINVELWREIVQRYHDDPTAEHPGKLQTFNAVKEHYWWPGLWVFIKNYVQGCRTCQQFKIDRNPMKPVFIPPEGAKSTKPFASCSMDLITVTTLILKKYRQSSNKFKHRVLRLIRMPVARYCLIVELVWVRSSIDS